MVKLVRQSGKHPQQGLCSVIYLQRVLETVERGTQANPLNGLAALLQAAPAPAQDNTAVEDDLTTAMDFINSL